MNLEELRSVQRAERQKDSLQHLRDSFYADVASYIGQLKEERERAVEVADDPFASDDVRQLTDKIEATTEVANALYERRVGKVVKHASFAAADMAADEDGLTTEERELFEDLVARIRENRETVLATLEGGRDAPSEPPTSVTDDGGAASSDASAADASDPNETTDTDGLLADALGDDGDASAAPPSSPVDRTADPEPSEAGVPDDVGPAAGTTAATPSADSRPSTESTESTDTAEQSSPDTDRTTLRITADVGTVYGVDEREYDLAREDVIDLPTTNAEPLLQKNAAERID